MTVIWYAFDSQLRNSFGVFFLCDGLCVCVCVCVFVCMCVCVCVCVQQNLTKFNWCFSGLLKRLKSDFSEKKFQELFTIVV